MSIKLFSDLYKEVGFEVLQQTDEKIDLSIDGIEIYIEIDEYWLKVINNFFKAKKYEFDSKKSILSAYKSIEFQITRLDSHYLTRPDYEFEDDKKNSIQISSATPEFSLSIITSERANQALEFILRRIRRRIASRTNNRKRVLDRALKFRLDDFLIVPQTARYEVKRKINKELLSEHGRLRIKAVLFKLSYTNNECWELLESIKSNDFIFNNEQKLDQSIPKANYKDELVTYYKVAKSSQFPNQAFLSYYHILEYYFLRVSDETIYNEAKSHINSLSFNSSYESVNKLLSIIKKNDKTSDETEMLKAVLHKYIQEDDLIEFIKNFEKNIEKKVYSDSKKMVFSEKATIRLEKGHSLGNTAKVIKVIRNSLVHSSDKYTREDCFLPLSEAESLVSEYLPLIKYLAENIIFSTAEI